LNASLRLASFRSAAACLVLSLASTCLAQSSPQNFTNADLVKMIQAGLPESVILNKIKSSGGTLDTSVDALIALKKAGATENELTTLTASPAVATPPAPTQFVPGPPVEALGGQLLRTRNGDPYIVFDSGEPNVFPTGAPSNSAFLVRYQGKPAILIPSTFDNFSCWVGNAIATEDNLLFDAYTDGCGLNNAVVVQLQAVDKKGQLQYKLPLVFSYADLSKAKTKKDTIFGKGIATDRSSAMLFVGVYPFLQHTGLMNFSSTDHMRSVAMNSFFQQLIHDPKGTIKEFEAAAGMTDPMTQLSPAATYEILPLSAHKRLTDIVQQRMENRRDNGNSWLQLAQGFQETQQMTSGLMNSAVGISKGDTAQLGSGLQSMASASGSSTLNEASSQFNNPSATASSAGTGSSAADTAGSTSSGSSYSGPNSEWVHRLLASAGSYSCSPPKAPATPTTFRCAGRDGSVYSAQTLAWASECSQQTGHPEDATKDANIMLDKLKTAGDLCTGMPTSCSTDTIVSCSQLPRH
jgi:hypothetical protein